MSSSGTASLIVTPAWSLHGGAQWTYAAAIGEPDLTAPQLRHEEVARVRAHESPRHLQLKTLSGVGTTAW